MRYGSIRYIFLAAFAVIIAATSAFGQVVKKTESRVTFTNFGDFTVEDEVYVTPEQQRRDEKKKFKGKGLLKGTLAKLILKSGETGQIIQPLEKRIVYLDHKDREYWIEDIRELAMSDSAPEIDETEPEETEKEPEREKESDIEIIRTEFKVTDHQEDKSINGFDCHHYGLLWLMEWRNKRTGETGIDSLYATIWTTPYDDELQSAMQVEQAFAQNHLGAMGFDGEAMQRNAVLGVNWLKIFGQLKQDESETPVPGEGGTWVEEMKKLQGFPIVVDGKYYAIRPQAEQAQAEAEEESDPSDVKGALGGFMKKKLFGKKKEPEGPQPAFAYYTEVKAYGMKDQGNGPFEIPGNYEKKK